MRFEPTAIPGVSLIHPDRITDERGFFARTFCDGEFRAAGFPFPVNQCSTSFNPRQGTLRGLHWLELACNERKIVRCTLGMLFDVALDLRAGSPSFGRWISHVLSRENGLQLVLPPGVAHGYQTLEDATEIFYMMSVPHETAALRGVRWNDPRFGIPWPLPPSVLSERDASFPDFDLPAPSM